MNYFKITALTFLFLIELSLTIEAQQKNLKGDEMSDVCRYKFLVIDNQDLWEINHLNRKVNQVVKHPIPVLKLDAPWDTPQDRFGGFNVIYDEQEKLFKMWYSVSKYHETPQPGKTVGTKKTAYATSKDGIHWEKPIMNMVEVNGSKNNNYILPNMKSFNYCITLDSSDIPARRYKMIFSIESMETEWAGFHSPLCLAYSADGIHWDRPTHVNPVLRGISDDVWSFLYDSDRRIYQLFTRRVPNIPRDISLYESVDLVNWEDKGRVLVGGDEVDLPEMYNLHGMYPFFYEDFCLGLLETMYYVPGAETYSAHNRPPKDWPFKNLGRVDIQLSYSRDGQKWHRPKDRSALLGIGQPGEPDAGMVFSTRNGPIVINGETWIYYVAVIWPHTWWAQLEYFERDKGVLRNQSCFMLAKMPEDHWVSLDADDQEGSLVCKPWGPPHEVFVNADAEGGSIAVELVTPYGHVIPGYSRDDCVAVMANGKDQQIKWKNGQHPWTSIGKDHLGGVLVKFYLKNAKLYSYTFTLPDPDGQLERDRLNARWTDHIKHRSGNWDRNSNEPAKGVPPYTGPRPKK